MSSVLPIDSVRQSRLFARLQEISGTDPTVSALVGNLPDLCREASDLMKALRAFHPQFTLNDATPPQDVNSETGADRHAT